MWLLFASTLVIAFAGIYSLTRDDVEGVIVEVVLTAVLAGSLLKSAVYLYTHYRKAAAEALGNKVSVVKNFAKIHGFKSAFKGVGTSDKALAKAFKKVDKDGSGSITVDECASLPSNECAREPA